MAAAVAVAVAVAVVGGGAEPRDCLEGAGGGCWWWGFAYGFCSWGGGGGSRVTWLCGSAAGVVPRSPAHLHSTSKEPTRSWTCARRRTRLGLVPNFHLGPERPGTRSPAA